MSIFTMRYLLYIILLITNTISATEKDIFPKIEDVFKFSAQVVDAKQIILDIKIPSGYYLYKDRLHIETINQHTRLEKIQLPLGIKITDPYSQEKTAVFSGDTQIVIPYTNIGKKLVLKIKFQGCSEQGLCYAPQIKMIPVELLANKTPSHIMNSSSTEKNGDWYFNLLQKNQDIFLIIAIFWLAGILLSFTPCVLPMIPILASVLGHSVGDRWRTILLTLTYVICMSATYALMGVLVGLFGASLDLQAKLQSPIAQGCFALLFFLLSLSMFEIFELSVPEFMRHGLMNIENTHTKNKGSVAGAGLMGVIAAMLASPCVTAPLVGALLYISMTQNALLGGVALFSLGLGMGTPLLAIGIGVGKIVPKSGQWMETVKRIFGICLLSMSLWMTTKLLSKDMSMIVTVIFITVIALLLPIFFRYNCASIWKKKIIKYFIGLILIANLLWSIDYFTNHFGWHKLFTSSTHQQKLHFITITNSTNLRKICEKAIKHHQPLLLDFYADWCSSCKNLDKNLFNDPSIISQLSHWLLVRFDISNATADQLKMMSKMKVFGAPTMIFYDNHGNEVKRLSGKVAVDTLFPWLANFSKNN